MEKRLKNLKILKALHYSHDNLDKKGHPDSKFAEKLRQ